VWVGKSTTSMFRCYYSSSGEFNTLDRLLTQKISVDQLPKLHNSGKVLVAFNSF